MVKADIYRPDLSLEQAGKEALKLQKELNIPWTKIKQKLCYPYSAQALKSNVQKATPWARDVLELLDTMDPEEAERSKLERVEPVFKWKFHARMHTVYSLEDGKLVSASWVE